MTKKITIVALVALMLLTAALPASAAIKATSVEIRGSVVQGNYTWDTSTFAGFFYDIDDDLGTETMSINVTGRTIAEDDLNYSTYSQDKMLKVVDAKYGDNGTLAAAAGLEEFAASDMAVGSGNYSIIGWQAEKYVAIKEQVNKLSKLLVEHGTSSAEKVTITTGETLELGGGFTITANSIDAKASPRQVWLTLSKDGVKLDDKVVTAGTTESDPIYTYVQKSLCGETDVPILVTYVDSIFAGATTDMVQFRYTWLISPTCTEVKSGDVYGSLKVTSSSGILTLKNSETTLSLSQDSVVDVMSNIKLKVADSSALRYYPFVEYVIEGAEGEVTPTPTVVVTTPTGNVTNVTTGNVTETIAAPPTEEAPEEAAAAEKKEPGFEAIFAIAGLLAVAFLVLRQRK